MKTIKQDELFQNVGDFLKSKGVELQDGSYTHRIRQGCNLLTEVINATQRTVKKARLEMDGKLGQLRQCIHQATAPKPSPAAGAKPPTGRATKSKQPRPSAAQAKSRRKK